MQHNFKYWKEEDGYIMPVVEKPDENNYWNGGKFNRISFEQDNLIHNASLKIRYKALGDISKIKGRGDLALNKDFHLQCQHKTLSIPAKWKNCSDDLYEMVNEGWRRIVAVIIEEELPDVDDYWKEQTRRRDAALKIDNQQKVSSYNQMLSAENAVIERLKEKGIIPKEQKLSVPNADTCSKHKKDIAGISDMKLLAEMIGDLHYESLALLFKELTKKLKSDSRKDWSAGKVQLSHRLNNSSEAIKKAYINMQEAWQISKPFM